MADRIRTKTKKFTEINCRLVKVFLAIVIRDAYTNCELAKRKKVGAMDVFYALNKLYGFKQ